MTDIAAHFAERASAYDRLAPWVYDPIIVTTTLEFLEVSAGQNIIDVGAGTGAALKAALVVCPQLNECVAVDLVPEMLDQIDDPRIHKHCENAEILTLPDCTFDSALCRQVLHYVSDPQQCLRSIYRILKESGSLIIGQVTPFSEKDEEYWKRILVARQPLRKHFLTLHDLVKLLVERSFVIVRVAQTRARESLNLWLDRYKEPKAHKELIRSLHHEAPEWYKEIHAFDMRGQDIVFENCWTFIRAVKA